MVSQLGLAHRVLTLSTQPARTGLREQVPTALRDEILNFAASRLRVCAMVRERLAAEEGGSGSLCQSDARACRRKRPLERGRVELRFWVWSVRLVPAAIPEASLDRLWRASETNDQFRTGHQAPGWLERAQPCRCRVTARG